MSATPYGASVKEFREDEPRQGIQILRIDPLLMLATLGLVGCGIYTIGTATNTDIPNDPNYYVVHQGVYAGVGVVFMLIAARFDYSRLREWRIGLYGLMIVSVLLTLGLGTATRGSKRWINFPFFNFQPSELGKVLLTLALAGFLVDRTRRLGERETTARIMLLAIVPAMLVIAQPDLGSGFVYITIALALLFVAGAKWTHFALLGVLGTLAVTAVLVVGPATGHHIVSSSSRSRRSAPGRRSVAGRTGRRRPSSTSSPSTTRTSSSRWWGRSSDSWALRPYCRSTPC
jgi:rod shape determining protein RodA